MDGGMAGTACDILAGAGKYLCSLGSVSIVAVKLRGCEIRESTIP